MFQKVVLLLAMSQGDQKSWKGRSNSEIVISICILENARPLKPYLWYLRDYFIPLRPRPLRTICLMIMKRATVINQGYANWTRVSSVYLHVEAVASLANIGGGFYCSNHHWNFVSERWRGNCRDVARFPRFLFFWNLNSENLLSIIYYISVVISEVKRHKWHF